MMWARGCSSGQLLLDQHWTDTCEILKSEKHMWLVETVKRRQDFLPSAVRNISMHRRQKFRLVSPADRSYREASFKSTKEKNLDTK